MFRLTLPITRGLAAATLLGAISLASPTYATSSDDAAPPNVTAKHSKAMHAAGIENRIAKLHGQLHITQAQEAQWAVVAQSMRDNAKGMDELIKDRSANAKKMTAIDDLQSYLKLAEAHEDGLKKFIPVFQTLYDAMSDQQKKVSDECFRAHQKHEAHHRT